MQLFQTHENCISKCRRANPNPHILQDVSDFAGFAALKKLIVVFFVVSFAGKLGDAD
jgi:hypothetical protein